MDLSVVGRAWAWRMEQEHLAVSVFSRLAIELAEHGCQPIVLALCTKAAADEVRHAEVCRDLARTYLGDDKVPAFVRGTRSPQAWPGATRAQALALDLAETCCVSETLTAAYLTRMLETAQGTAAEMVRSLLADEVDHGRLGWAYLNELRTRGESLAFIGAALPAILERQTADVLAPSGVDDLSLEPYGYLGAHVAANVYRSGLADVVLPGFDAVGVDTSTARAWLAGR